MISDVKKLLFVSRPISWINTAFPFAVVYFLATQRVDALLIFGTLFLLIPYNIIMYGINDVYDYESDMKNPRKNSLEGAREAKSFHPFILRACAWLMLICTPIMIWLAPAPASVITYAVMMFFVVAYSIKGLRFKEIPVLDSITSSMHFTLPLVYASVITGTVIEVLPYSVALFFWGMASHAFGAVQDIKPDREGGIASIATSIGARRTVWFCIILYALAALLMAYLGASHYIVALVALAYIVNIWEYRTVDDETSDRTNVAWRRFIWLNYIAGFIITMVIISDQMNTLDVLAPYLD